MPATASGKANEDNLARYDETDMQHVFNWQTDGLSEGIYWIRVDLGDGLTYAIKVTLK